MLLTSKMHSNSNMCQKKCETCFVSLIIRCTSHEKCMSCMFYGKILMCSSSAFICLDLLFLLGLKIWIMHACETFSMMISYCVNHGKNMNCAVWYFS
jgi:hypothetical protein